MPSSMIFVGLVVVWLLILVPAVARRRQEVARPSVAALSGRVLERAPRRDPDADRVEQASRDVEVDVRHEPEPTRTGAEGRQVPAPRGETVPRGGDLDSLDGWTWHDPDDEAEPEPAARARPTSEPGPGTPTRYRPGRGGYDPQAAALSARARYAFRQRVVLVLLVLVVGTAVVAALTVPQLWWAHGAVDLALVGYLVYLRRQVRVEEAIRRRRSARVGAGRRAPQGEPEEQAAPARAADRAAERRRPTEGQAADVPASRRPADDLAAEEEGDAEDDGEPSEAASPRGAVAVAAPAVAPAKAPEAVDAPPALPRLKPIPTPPVPMGTTLVEGEEDDPALHELDSVARPDYRRASGQ